MSTVIERNGNEIRTIYLNELDQLLEDVTMVHLNLEERVSPELPIEVRMFLYEIICQVLDLKRDILIKKLELQG